MGLFFKVGPWAQLQSYSRLDTREIASNGANTSVELIRGQILAGIAKLSRAREGFVRHCAAMQTDVETNSKALRLWIEAACLTVADARRVLGSVGDGDARSTQSEVQVVAERRLADEYLSAQFWGALTDCARSLADAVGAAEEQPEAAQLALIQVETALASALTDEMAFRQRVGFENPDFSNPQRLEAFLERTRGLKQHFQRVLYLETQSVQLVERLHSWFAAAAAVVAYLCFFAWQIFAQQHRGHWPLVGSSVVAFALITSIAYASREKLKEAACAITIRPAFGPVSAATSATPTRIANRTG